MRNLHRTNSLKAKRIRASSGVRGGTPPNLDPIVDGQRNGFSDVNHSLNVLY